MITSFLYKMDNEYYVFLLDNRKVNIQRNPDDLRFLQKMPSDIRKKLCFNEPYSIKSKVQYENLQLFLNYLDDNNNINDLSDMISNNFFDYFLLNSEFGIEKNYDENGKNSIIENINTASSYGKLVCEEYISKNLDYYLGFNEDQLRQISITSLYNIFFNNKRQLNDRNQEKAYQLIKSIVNNGNENKSFCILFNSLDGSKISSESLRESFDKRNERFNCMPNLANSFFDVIDKKISDIKSHNDESFVEQRNHFTDIINDLNQSITNAINNLGSNMNEFRREINNDIRHISQRVSDIETNIRNDISDIRQNIARIPTKFNNQNPLQVMSNDIARLFSKIDTFTRPINDIENIKIDLEKIPKKFDGHNPLRVISNNVTTLISEISNINTSINNFKNQNDQIQSDVDTLSDTIDFTKNDIISNVKEEMQRNIMFSHYLLQNEKKQIEFLYGKNSYTYLGLLSYFNFMYGNPFEYSDWEISGNSEIGYEDALKHLCEEDNSKSWRSKNEKDSYFQIYTGSKYSFKFDSIQYWHESTENQIKNFTLEKSNDGVNWIKEELKKNTEDRNSYGKFDSDDSYDSNDSATSNGFYKWFRFKNESLNSSNNYRICLERVELYGILKTSSQTIEKQSIRPAPSKRSRRKDQISLIE